MLRAAPAESALNFGASHDGKNFVFLKINQPNIFHFKSVLAMSGMGPLIILHIKRSVILFKL